MVVKRRAVHSIERTSSWANVPGASLKRQKETNKQAANQNKCDIVQTLSWKGVSGTVPLVQRPGAKAFLEMVAAHPNRTLYVPEASRLARRLSVQEEAVEVCKSLNIYLRNSSDPDYYTSESPEGVLRRQIMGAVDEYEHKKILARLKDGRERKRTTTTIASLKGKKKVEGRRSFLDLHPKFVQQISTILVRPFALLQTRSGTSLSVRAIAAKLVPKGVVTQCRKTRAGKQLPGAREMNSGTLLRWLKQCDRMCL
jgi:DNA invertase Pin-like site-specific DNA recombinase